MIFLSILLRLGGAVTIAVSISNPDPPTLAAAAFMVAAGQSLESFHASRPGPAQRIPSQDMRDYYRPT